MKKRKTLDVRWMYSDPISSGTFAMDMTKALRRSNTIAREIPSAVVGGNFRKIHLRRWGEGKAAELFCCLHYVNERKIKNDENFFPWVLVGVRADGATAAAKKMRRGERNIKNWEPLCWIYFSCSACPRFLSSPRFAHGLLEGSRRALFLEFCSGFCLKSLFLSRTFFWKKIKNTLNFFYYLNVQLPTIE